MANKYKYENTTFGGKQKGGTRKGVHPTPLQEKLVNVTNDQEIRRVRRSIAENLVKTGEWRYCPKKFKLGSQGG